MLSGSFDLICKALEVISIFDKAAPEELSTSAFASSAPHIKHYLAQIKQVCEATEAYHALQGQNLSGVFGIAKQFYNSRLTNKNASLTTDGEYLYLYAVQSQQAFMYKIGSGIGTTTAGRVYISTQVEKEGDLSWVYCTGRLYARRNNVDFGNLVVYDPKNLKKLGEARFVCDEMFRGNKVLKKANSNYPLLTDGESLYALIMTVEKRERVLQEGMDEMQ